MSFNHESCLDWFSPSESLQLEPTFTAFKLNFPHKGILGCKSDFSPKFCCLTSQWKGFVKKHTPMMHIICLNFFPPEAPISYCWFNTSWDIPSHMAINTFHSYPKYIIVYPYSLHFFIMAITPPSFCWWKKSIETFWFHQRWQWKIHHLLMTSLQKNANL